MTHGVVSGGGGGADVADGKYGVSTEALPPPMDAGLTQATSMPTLAVAVCPLWRLTPWPGTPKSELAGGCEGKLEYAITHPDWAVAVQSGR